VVRDDSYVMQQQRNCWESAFYGIVPRLYNEDQVPLVSQKVSPERERERESMQAVSWELQWEAGSWGQGHFGNPEEGDHPQLGAATKQRNEDRYWEHQFVCDSDL
jgi:hypothetical protein